MTTIVLDKPLAAGTYTLTAVKAPPVVTTPPPAVPGQPAGTIWANGAFGPGWQNDDWTSDVQSHSSQQITMKDAEPWGMWIPYATRLDGGPTNGKDGQYDTTPYTHLVVSLEPSQDGQIWSMWFEPAGGEDTPEATVLFDSTAKYGPAPKKGVMATYNVPLTDLGIGTPAFPGNMVRKIGLQDKAPGNVGNVWQVGQARFV